jgi:hypothetical protein
VQPPSALYYSQGAEGPASCPTGNETEVGIALKESGLSRSDIWVTVGTCFSLLLEKTETQLTHAWVPQTKWSGRPWGNGESIDPATSLDESLSKLGLKHVDLYLVHTPRLFGSRDNIRHGWKEIVALQKSGKTKSIGVSNFTLDDMKELIEGGEKRPEMLPAANQVCAILSCLNRLSIRADRSTPRPADRAPPLRLGRIQGERRILPAPRECARMISDISLYCLARCRALTLDHYSGHRHRGLLPTQAADDLPRRARRQARRRDRAPPERQARAGPARVDQVQGRDRTHNLAEQRAARGVRRCGRRAAIRGRHARY